MGQLFKKLAWVLLLPLFIFYNNCDSFKSSQPDSELNLSQCDLTQKASLERLGFDKQRDCNNLDLIDCEIREFRPDIDNRKTSLIECIENKDGTICFDLNYFQFNTSEADSNPELYEPGQAYNYLEYNCFYQDLYHQEKAIFHSSAPNLSTAVDKVQKRCLEGE